MIRSISSSPISSSSRRVRRERWVERRISATPARAAASSMDCCTAVASPVSTAWARGESAVRSRSSWEGGPCGSADGGFRDTASRLKKVSNTASNVSTSSADFAKVEHRASLNSTRSP